MEMLQSPLFLITLRNKMASDISQKNAKLTTAIYVLPRIILMLPMVYVAYIGYPHRIPINVALLLGSVVPFSYAANSLIVKYAKANDLDMSCRTILHFSLQAMSVLATIVFAVFTFGF